MAERGTEFPIRGSTAPNAQRRLKARLTIGPYIVLALAIGVPPAPAAVPAVGGRTPKAPDIKPQTESTNDSATAQQGDLVTLPAGTVISVRLADTVDSNKNHTADQFSGTVDPSVLIANHVVIPRGTEADVRMVKDIKGGRIHGHAEVELVLESLIINSTKVDVVSDVYRQKKGMIAAKVKAEAKADTGAAAEIAGDGVTANPNPLAAGGPVVAVFRAADVRKPAGSKIDFTLTEPFTFAKPPETTKP